MEGHERQDDAEQLAVLRRLRAAFGHVQVLAVQIDDQGKPSRPAGRGRSASSTGGTMDPHRMTTEELREVEALLRRAVTTPAPAAASDALDELMRRLLVLHRLLEAELRLSSQRLGRDR
jgi:hypothetical protein